MGKLLTTVVSSGFKKTEGIVSAERQGVSPGKWDSIKGVSLSSFQIGVREMGSGRLTGGFKE